MSELIRDPIHGPAPLPLDPGETLLAEWRADRANYWRGHAIMAAIGSLVAGAALVATGNPDPWVGPVAAVTALGIRGAYLASESLGLSWRLTDRRLLGPGGRNMGLGEITKARRFLGDVQVITRSGDKHLMKHMADAATVIAAIESAQTRYRA